MKPANGSYRLATVGAAVIAALAGCGGGGSDGPAPAASAPARVAPAAAQASSSTPILVAAGPARQVGGERIDRLQWQLDVLRRQVEDLQRQLSRGLPASQVVRPEIDESARDPQQEEELRLSGHEAGFRNEPVEAGWSQSAAASVRTVLAQASEGLASRVQSIDCRSRTCRVMVSPQGGEADKDDTAAIVDRLAHLFPNANVGRSGQADGPRSTVLYLSR